MKTSLRAGLLGLLLVGQIGCSKSDSPAQAPAGGAAVAAPSAGGAGDSTVVAKIGEQTITMADLDKKAGRELYELRERTLDNMIAEQLLEIEAKKAGQTIEQWIRGEAERRVPDVSEQEAEAFFNQNQARLPPQLASQPFAAVKDQLIKGVTNQKRSEEVGKIIEELKTKNNVVVMLEPPRIQVAAEGPSMGPADAKVTIVEFSDFECPYCGRAADTVHEVMKKYDGKVRLVFRDYPLPFHSNAQKASEAALCANEQGKFWELHDWMFKNQKTLDVPSLKTQAGTLGLDTTKFNECVDSGKFAKTVETNMAAGKEAGVTGTPAFFINGVFINGAQPIEKFSEVIDKELARVN